MRTGRNIRVIFMTAGIAMFLLVSAPGQAQKLPPSTIIGTNPAGSLFYSVASGLAKVISGAGPMQAVVQPYTGSSTFLPMLDNGELDFGMAQSDVQFNDGPLPAMGDLFLLEVELLGHEA